LFLWHGDSLFSHEGLQIILLDAPMSSYRPVSLNMARINPVDDGFWRNIAVFACLKDSKNPFHNRPPQVEINLGFSNYYRIYGLSTKNFTTLLL
jgi:hypothetical protein